MLSVLAVDYNRASASLFCKGPQAGYFFWACPGGAALDLNEWLVL
jgi:hypothetical protein